MFFACTIYTWKNTTWISPTHVKSFGHFGVLNEIYQHSLTFLKCSQHVTNISKSTQHGINNFNVKTMTFLFLSLKTGEFVSTICNLCGSQGKFNFFVFHGCPDWDPQICLLCEICSRSGLSGFLDSVTEPSSEKTAVSSSMGVVPLRWLIGMISSWS